MKADLIKRLQDAVDAEAAAPAEVTEIVEPEIEATDAADHVEAAEDEEKLTPMEQRKRRAERFGVEYKPTPQELKRLRQEKFGTLPPKQSGKAAEGASAEPKEKKRGRNKRAEPTEEEIEHLRQRAIKFGTELPAAVRKFDEKRKQEERRQRFASQQPLSSSS